MPAINCMHYVMHYVMHRKMGWPSLDRVLSKMAEASLRSYSWGSYNTSFTVGLFVQTLTSQTNAHDFHVQVSRS